MMRESVSHPAGPVRSRSSCFQWCALVGVGALTVLTGIGVLMALMSPENLKAVPTVMLVCVLVLLCVPVPVLMLERSRRKSAARAMLSATAEPSQGTDPEPRAIIHGSHIPHNTHPESHRTMRTNATIPNREPASSAT